MSSTTRPTSASYSAVSLRFIVAAACATVDSPRAFSCCARAPQSAGKAPGAQRPRAARSAAIRVAQGKESKRE